jgi:salicylate hydroxylase
MTVSVDTTSKPFTIAVVGGGIGGIALAIGLLHRGVAVQVYEASPAFAEIGAGIGFGPNSVRSMHLINPAIKAAFDGLVTKNEGENEEETWINFRCGIGEPELIAKVRTTDSNKTGISSVHRAHFLHELVKLVPAGMANFGKRLSNLHPGPRGTVRLEFEDGTMAEAAAVVGCDGVRSRVRRILRSQENDVEDMQFSGKFAYRGLIPMDKAKAALGDDLAGNTQMYLGPGGHILTYPIDHGKILNVAAFRTKEDGKWEHNRWILQKTREDMKESYDGWGEPVQKITEVRNYS